MEKLTVRKGGMFSCDWLLPVLPMVTAAAFIVTAGGSVL
jgi:hypothetical protein